MLTGRKMDNGLKFCTIYGLLPCGKSCLGCGNIISGMDRWILDWYIVQWPRLPYTNIVLREYCMIRLYSSRACLESGFLGLSTSMFCCREDICSVYFSPNSFLLGLFLEEK